ncbi:fibronectin type III domain-containing protein 9 [Callorhinchus milii]|uniref:Fibronectin type-III domain-containing protein n=1 Tax=Callorhinchus milii TaxID=7868 RepID=A0A4W3I5H1_CALMI|nr:fibronectin type III domain-containing protein 9 [Callorhinchus milii]
MKIEVKNISFTSALVSWSPPQRSCLRNFYQIMYRPNWNRILSGISRQNFPREKLVPLSHTSITLKALTPSTQYIFCMACQGTHLSRDQCTTFHTMAKETVVVGGKKLDLAMIVWLTSSTLLIIIVIILLYGCFKMWVKRCKRNAKGYNLSHSTTANREASQAWHVGNAETALVEVQFEVPTLALLDRFAESKSDALIEKAFSGTKNLLSQKRDSDKRAILPQSGYE